MSFLNQIGPASAALSISLAAVAAALGYWQHRDRRDRQRDLSPEDAAHFVRQDLRRFVVMALMILIAAGILVGSRISHRVAGRPNPQFVLTWYAVLLALLLMVGLALFDWVATRRYARRHRRHLLREGIEILKDELHRQAHASSQRNGSEGNGRVSPLP